MIKNNFLLSAYDTYSDILNIINTISDNCFISVSEFSKLLAVILNVNEIKPHFINKLLIDKNLLVKTVNSSVNNKNFKTSKYIPTPQASRYSKKVSYNEIYFYLWDFNILSGLFDIDFKETLTENSAKNICRVMKKYLHMNFNIDNVFTNLIKLQVLFRNECNLF